MRRLRREPATHDPWSRLKQPTCQEDDHTRDEHQRGHEQGDKARRAATADGVDRCGGAAQMAGLLDLADTADNELLRDRIAASGPADDVVLTAAEEQAYQCTVTSFLAGLPRGRPAQLSRMGDIQRTLVSPTIQVPGWLRSALVSRARAPATNSSREITPSPSVSRWSKATRVTSACMSTAP